jgi:hypothetical protein
MRAATVVSMLVMATMIPVNAFGQGFEAEGEKFVLRRGERYIQFTPPGTWVGGVEGGKHIRWGMVLWHDEWVFEHLSQGTVTEGPTLNEDGSISVAGTFVNREGAPPMEFSLVAMPTEAGLSVKCEVKKTAELRLRRGVLVCLWPNKEVFDGSERAYLRPVSLGTVASGVSGFGDRLLVELDEQTALAFAADGYAFTEHRNEGSSYTLRTRLTEPDFPVGETVATNWSVSFDTMPAEIPGQILPARGELVIESVTPSAEAVPAGRMIELAVGLSASYDNPFDPDDVALDAEFTAPSGALYSVPGFFMVDMDREVRDGGEVLVPRGNGRWCVRFTPTEVGEHGYRLRLRDRSGEITGGEGDFTATEREGHGFLRASRADPHYFAFDDGTGWFAIGHNLPTYHVSGQLGPEAMARMAAAGENYNRWWMHSGSLGIEWEERLGWYRQATAYRVDYMLEQAEELGMHFMMCMDTHQDYRQEGWKRNPYNAERGGPCETPADWFTNEQARAYYRKRLRYTVARWGHSPHVLCWEFGNEMQGWAESPVELQLPWHREMAAYLRSIDPYRHLITTSFWGGTGFPEFWRIPEIDIVQTHCYTNTDEGVAPIVRDYCLEQWRNFGKPHIFAEFGIRSRGNTADRDPEGWALHNALWAAATSLCAGGPMPWWHESYIDPLNLYFHFTAIARFTEGLPLGTARWRPLEAAETSFVDPQTPALMQDVVVIPRYKWERPEHSEFVIREDGTIEGERLPLVLLQGRGHADLRNPPTFVVSYPEAGRFIVHVDRVSNSGDLRIWLDEQEVLHREFATGEGLGKESVYREQWKMWETVYDEDVVVEVPAGLHRIRLHNDGKDWIRVPSYTFTGCRVVDRPNVLICGMRSDEVVVAWAQNRSSTWAAHASGEGIPQVAAFKLDMPGFEDGVYEVEWWETWRGSVAHTGRARARDGLLGMHLGPLETDVALKIRRVE